MKMLLNTKNKIISSEYQLERKSITLKDSQIEEAIQLYIKKLTFDIVLDKDRQNTFYSDVKEIANHIVNPNSRGIINQDITKETYLKISDRLWKYITDGYITPIFSKYRNEIIGFHLTEKGEELKKKLINKTK